MQQSSWRPVFYVSAVERSAFCYSTILTVSYPASWLTIKLSATKCEQHICYYWWLLSSCSQSVTTSGQLENCPRLWIKDRRTALPSMLTLTLTLIFCPWRAVFMTHIHAEIKVVRCFKRSVNKWAEVILLPFLLMSLVITDNYCLLL